MMMMKMLLLLLLLLLLLMMMMSLADTRTNASIASSGRSVVLCIPS
jgi:hypothetical protein